MKTLLSICLFLPFLRFNAEKNPGLTWLRSSLTTLKSNCGNNHLPFTITKTYRFYDSAFVIRTDKVFEDRELNGPPYFSKVFYKDIILKDTSGIRNTISQQHGITEESCPDFLYFSLEVKNLFTAASREPADYGKWFSMNEPTSLVLYLPPNKDSSTSILKNLVQFSSGF